MVGRHPIRLTADEALCWIYSVLHLLTLLFQQHRYSTTVKKCIFLGSKYYLVFHRLCSSNLEPLQFGTFTGENEFWLMIILSNTVTYIYFISPPSPPYQTVFPQGSLLIVDTAVCILNLPVESNQCNQIIIKKTLYPSLEPWWIWPGKYNQSKDHSRPFWTYGLTIEQVFDNNFQHTAFSLIKRLPVSMSHISCKPGIQEYI